MEDGTEVEDQEYFEVLPNNTILLLLKKGEVWERSNPESQDEVKKEDDVPKSEVLGLLEKIRKRKGTSAKVRCADNQHDEATLAIGWTARNYLTAHDDLPPETVNKFFRSVREFYCTTTETMVKKFPFNDKVLKGIGFLNPSTKDKISTDDIVSLSERFCSFSQEEKRKLEDEAAEYILTPLSDLPKFDPDTTTLNQYWNSLGKLKLPRGQKQFQHLYNLSKNVLTLPHSNADTERVFSVLKKIQSDSRDNLADKTIHSLLSSKINNPIECHQYKPEPEVVKVARTACALYKQSILSS
ncbi:uncharacterized protein LOC133199855 [Saccostrea echinata]|uniref:uncharacterized protein LOC133199855 n=1 Tax=Saccostrea echinata TaxID=191078 RepID=UPI002A7EACE8|nr:uncharacterized protein LOC133199855 [Saccostrea echinata]